MFSPQLTGESAGHIICLASTNDPGTNANFIWSKKRSSQNFVYPQQTSETISNARKIHLLEKLFVL